MLCAIAAAAVIAPALVVTHAPATPVRPRLRVKAPPQRVVPKAEVPPVEPVAFVDLPPDEARAFNAGVPFSTAPNPAARPFRFAGSAEDRARALDCLATAVIYEAGDDSVGERAVAQVILNRLRHPAFPKTVCGVVFEGQERTTGCQFTFTCDGALTRWHPSDIAWRRARQVAELALNGAVYRPVGYATHYHTDWVVPYWQSSLDKVAGVGSHLFFRWSSWWGTPPAFNRRWTGGEPVIAKLADRSDAHRMGGALVAADAAMVEALVASDGAVPAS
ncbi:cell wall hydrolase, partial [uncultured Sphingomonas sp.]|uniref:cell wall hydrolase n=1 Tax=uncultured Sphingomonas sp. TaxID=158754 RepID=UPI00260F6D05